MNTVSAADNDTIYVATNGSDSNNGLSWDKPKFSIKNATGTVNNGGIIHIANGIYTGENNTNITIDRNMNLIGQSMEGTIINAEHNWIFIINPNVIVTMQNLTLKNGTARWYTSGGAIVNNGNLTVTNCAFTDNTAGYGGGAISNIDGVLTVNNCIFENNQVSYLLATGGGAIYNNGGTLTVTGSSFIKNKIDGDKSYGGGAIYNTGGIMTVTGSTFTNNTSKGTYSYGGGAIYNTLGLCNVFSSKFSGNSAFADGGAIYNYKKSGSTLNDCTFTGNIAGAWGGAIYNEDNCTVNKCTFNANNVEYQGGAIFNYDGNLTVIESNFIENHASARGGAISIFQGTNIFSSCSFSSNLAPSGGAINNNRGILNITGCNFNQNHATNFGGAIYTSGTLNAKYSRFVGNTAAGIINDILMDYQPNLNVALNWWGSNSGPAAGRITVLGYDLNNEDYTPWLVMNINANPSTIYTRQTSKIIANVYMDSEGVDHSADASQFFSGPEVTFTSTLGTIGSYIKTVDWILGQAVRTYTGILAGKDPITATDGQIVTTTINVLQAPTVNAATVGMQETGIPIIGLILAILAVLGGSLASKK